MEFSPFRFEYPAIVLASVIGVIVTVFLFYRLNFPGSVPYFRELLGHRAQKIEDVQNQVERALAEIKQSHDDYSARLASIEIESRRRIDAAVREADTARAEIIAEAQEAAEAVRRRNEDEVARQRLRYRIQLRREVVQITLDAAEQSVLANAGEAVQRQLIQDFIARAGDTDGKSAPVATETRTVAPSADTTTTPTKPEEA